MFIKCDVSDEKQMNEAYNKVLDKFHRLDIVINNAAILSAEENLYKRMVDVNFVSTMHFSIVKYFERCTSMFNTSVLIFY